MRKLPRSRHGQPRLPDQINRVLIAVLPTCSTAPYLALPCTSWPLVCVCARMAAMWLRLPAGRGFPPQGVAPPLSLLPSHPIRPASHILQAVWSLVFALSCNLLVLVLYEIVGIMDPG